MRPPPWPSAPSRTSTGELVLFANDAPRLELTAEKDTHVILLSGQPLNERSSPTRPFVMNTLEESIRPSPT
jgi:redox-sensitive bicupin YhaK (pirin superfamily)